jgi:hypothetical protein
MRLILVLIALCMASAWTAETSEEARERLLHDLTAKRSNLLTVINSISKLGGAEIDAALPVLVDFAEKNPDVRSTGAVQSLQGLVQRKSTPITEDQIAQLRGLMKDSADEAFSQWILGSPQMAEATAGR